MPESLYLVRGVDVERLKQILLTDDVASRANILLRDASQLSGRQGLYIRVIGTEGQLKRIEEIVGSSAEKVEGRELEDVLTKLKEEDERVLSGLGGIFS